MALKTVFEYCFNAIEFYPKSNRFVLASRRKSNHFVLKIRLGGFADYNFFVKCFSRHCFLRLLRPAHFRKSVFIPAYLLDP